MGVEFPEIGWDSEDIKTQTKHKFSLIQKQSVGPGNISVIYYPSGVGIPSLSKVFYYTPSGSRPGWADDRDRAGTNKG